jgi:hypothetical protein
MLFLAIRCSLNHPIPRYLPFYTLLSSPKKCFYPLCLAQKDRAPILISKPWINIVVSSAHPGKNSASSPNPSSGIGILSVTYIMEKTVPRSFGFLISHFTHGKPKIDFKSPGARTDVEQLA